MIVKQGERMSRLHKMTENNFNDRINLYLVKGSTFIEQKFGEGTIT